MALAIDDINKLRIRVLRTLPSPKRTKEKNMQSKVFLVRYGAVNLVILTIPAMWKTLYFRCISHYKLKNRLKNRMMISSNSHTS